MGPRVTVRDWQIADLDRYAYWLEPGRRWKDFDAPYYPGPALEEIPERVAAKRAEIEASTLPLPRTHMAIASRDTNELIGMMIRYWESRETNWLSLGIAIYDPAHWGQGLGYEALGLWTDYIFREMPEVVRADLRTWSGHSGMIRLAQKLGYVEEARFRKARIVHGTYYDGMAYGVLREEWEQRYPGGFGAQW